MKTNDVVQDGNPLVNWDADTYVEQYRNGRFVVRRGYPDRPGDIVFDSGVDRSEGNYFTKLQHDGNLLTFKGTPDDKEGDSVWKTGSTGAIAQYFLGIECDLKSISIYEYMPEDPGKLMWTTGEYPSPTPDLMLVPTSAPVSATVSPTKSAMPSGSAPSIEAVGNDDKTTEPASTPTLSPVANGTAAPSMGAGAGGVDLPQVVAVDGSYCTPDAPCPQCYGDCDTDEDCQGTLECYQRDGGQEVPSCGGGEEKTSGNEFHC